jgi:hypothetical protein
MKIQAEYKITTFRHWMLKDSWQKKKKVDPDISQITA